MNQIVKEVSVTASNSWRRRKLVRLPSGYKITALELVSGSLGLRLPIGPIYAMPSGVVVHGDMEAGDRIRLTAIVP